MPKAIEGTRSSVDRPSLHPKTRLAPLGTFSRIQAPGIDTERGPRTGSGRGGRGDCSPLIEAKGDKAQIALAFDQQQDRFPSRFLGVLDPAADVAGALYLFLRGLHDQIARAQPFGGRRAVLRDI